MPNMVTTRTGCRVAVETNSRVGIKIWRTLTKLTHLSPCWISQPCRSWVSAVCAGLQRAVFHLLKIVVKTGRVRVSCNHLKEGSFCTAVLAKETRFPTECCTFCRPTSQKQQLGYSPIYFYFSVCFVLVCFQRRRRILS